MSLLTFFDYADPSEHIRRSLETIPETSEEADSHLEGDERPDVRWDYFKMSAARQTRGQKPSQYQEELEDLEEEDEDVEDMDEDDADFVEEEGTGGNSGSPSLHSAGSSNQSLHSTGSSSNMPSRSRIGAIVSSHKKMRRSASAPSVTKDGFFPPHILLPLLALPGFLIHFPLIAQMDSPRRETGPRQSSWRSWRRPFPRTRSPTASSGSTWRRRWR